MSDFLLRNLPVIRAAVDDHNGNCPVPARAILLHPTDQEKLGVSDLWGLAVCPDDRVRLGYFRIDCEGSAWLAEDELLAYIQAPAVEEAPDPGPLTPSKYPLALGSG